MIYRLLRWLIVAALAASIAYVLSRPDDVAAAPMPAGCYGDADQTDEIAATPCAPCAHALCNESGDSPPIP